MNNKVKGLRLNRETVLVMGEGRLEDKGIKRVVAAESISRGNTCDVTGCGICMSVEPCCWG